MRLTVWRVRPAAIDVEAQCMKGEADWMEGDADVTDGAAECSMEGRLTVWRVRPALWTVTLGYGG